MVELASLLWETKLKEYCEWKWNEAYLDQSSLSLLGLYDSVPHCNVWLKDENFILIITVQV